MDIHANCESIKWSAVPELGSSLLDFHIFKCISINYLSFHSFSKLFYSLSNSKERELVISYVDDLLENGLGDGRKLEEGDIGIISPYRSQCMKIQEDLNIVRKFQIEIGSVEAYRGKEKAVIIVSFVRSKCKSLGFLNNSKVRFTYSIYTPFISKKICIYIYIIYYYFPAFKCYTFACKIAAHSHRKWRHTFEAKWLRVCH